MDYKESLLLQYLHENSTIIQCSYPSTSQQNGWAEGKYRHVLETTRALIISASCLENFWGEATLTVFYSNNGIPSPIIHNQTLL